MKEEKIIETFKHWIEYEKANKDRINKADELIEIQQGLLDLYNKEKQKNIRAGELLGKRINMCNQLQIDLDKEKEKNKELLEGLKYRVNYCNLLEKELYEDTDMEYEMELTKIEQKYIQELLKKEE